MGEVYLARDTQLDREVALKVLVPEIAADGQRLQRFLQEARAASKLKGAHAAHIYDVGEAGGTYFIAMEYAEGQTLDRVIEGRTLDARETVRLGSQIAEAHARGVTHRDIKPANVIVTPRGQAKVLDFGLAKLSAGDTEAESEAATRVKTSPNAVMGTVSYMSPEQSLGRASIDQRTDIWSLGVVLYEMLAGRLPFEGESVTAIIDSIVHTQPAAIARFNYDVPPELEVIVKKALRKNPDERYQTARDLLTDLRSLERELSLTDARSQTIAPDPRAATFATGVGVSRPANEQATDVRSPTQASRLPPQSTAETEATRPTVSSAEYVAGRIKSHKFAVAVALLLVAVLIAGGAFAVYRFAGRGKTQTSAGSMKVTRLTSTGKATMAAISPDGKYVVHVKSEGGQESLWLRQTVTTSDTQIVAPGDRRYRGLTFSPDGNYVYYVVADGRVNSLTRALYQLPALGGTERKVLDDVHSPISFAPDGKRFAFMRIVPGQKDPLTLMVANADGSGEQKLAARPDGSGYTLEGPAWSPDGKVIACGAQNFAGGRYWNLVTVNVADGVEKEVTARRWGYLMGQVAWLADGSGLVMVAKELTSVGPRQLWYVSYPGGEVRQITNDLNEYRGVSIAADSGTLVTVQSDTTANVSIAPATDASRVKQLTNGKSEGQTGLSWMPDGRVVYDSNASGSSNIWVTDQDGRNQKQLTNDTGGPHTPSTTPDGRYIFFVSTRSVTQNIWRMNVDGSNPVQLTHGNNEFWVLSSPDSKWAIYTSTDSGKTAMWKVPVEGGERVRLNDSDTRSASVSPDMKLIACLYREDQVNSPFKVAIYSFDAGRLIKLLDISQFINVRAGLRWSTDGRALTYIDTHGGISNIWSLPLDGGAAKQLTNFTSEQIFSFDLSRDGKQFAFSRGTVIDDVVLVSNFK
jgi:serine/threonine protein kinase/Tol biopolymer transport system component